MALPFHVRKFPVASLLSLGKLEVQAITSSTHKPSENILEVTYSGSPVKTDEVAVEIWKQTAPPAVDTIKVHAGGQRSTWSGDPQAGNFVAPPIAGYTREGWIQSPNQVEDSSLTYTLFLEENTDGYAPPEPRKSHWETQKVTNYKWSGLYKYKKAL